jgi:lipopolysaccharide/colanic/teichoic acid biosynthesis glycosyltransferase
LGRLYIKVRGFAGGRSHDIYYIENWSLALDLYILIATPFKLFNQDGAY